MLSEIKENQVQTFNIENQAFYSIFSMEGLRITAEKGFYCFNLPYQMSDGPKAITRTCFKNQLQLVINQYGQEESQNTKSEMQHFPAVCYLDKTDQKVRQ